MQITPLEYRGAETLGSALPEHHGRKLYIYENLLQELRDHGNSSPDQEVCGLVTGNVAASLRAETYYPITNISTNSLGYDDYMMDPQESMDVLKHTQVMPFAEKWKHDLVAIFHTHPHGTPFPSMIDVKTAAYNVVYIIYSVSLDKFSFNYWNGEWFVPLDAVILLER